MVEKSDYIDWYIQVMNNNAKKRIGKYMIFLGAKLGEGAFAQVYQGINE